MTIIGLKELSQNAGRIAERVQKGERFTVVKRSKPVFVISKPNDNEGGLSTWMEDYLQKNEALLTSLKDK